LIPSRKHTSGLARAIHSVGNVDGVELLVRADEDDNDTIKTAEHLAKSYPVTLIVGPRLQGYSSIGHFVTELAAKAKGTWISCLDDDVTLEGSGWEKQLEQIPTSGRYVLTEFYFLGPSKYSEHNGRGVAGWFVPNGCWQQWGLTEIGNPTDAWMQKVLFLDRNWQITYLKGIVYNHHWHETRK
jgi:hypothetical protein